MRFYKQERSGTCQLIAAQHVWSYFGKDIPIKEISKELPKHTFGNFCSEIGLYFESQGLKTTLVSNQVPFESTNKPLLSSLEEYKKTGNFTKNIPNTTYFNTYPLAVINVDWYKVRSLKGGSGGHYVVLVKEGPLFWLFDGSNYRRKVKKSFDYLLRASLDINRFHENGMWLFVK
jgi:hypothetical protein